MKGLAEAALLQAVHAGQVPEEVRAAAEHGVADGAAGHAAVHAEVLPQRAALLERLAALRALVHTTRVPHRRLVL